MVQIDMSRSRLLKHAILDGWLRKTEKDILCYKHMILVQYTGPQLSTSSLSLTAFSWTSSSAVCVVLLELSAHKEILTAIRRWNGRIDNV